VNGHVWNDVFLSECIHSIPDMLVVHSEKFHPGACAEMMGANRVDPAKVLDAFSLHKVFGSRHGFYTHVQDTWKGGGYPGEFGGLPANMDWGKSFTGGQQGK